MAKKRILLSAVFGPYGVDDEFGRKESLMELFHNQVTKAQGHASLRYHHRSFGLYFLAENVSAPVTILDFPTRDQFVRMLNKERFDAVGISFIVPNVSKAKEMASLVRQIQPHAEIILGGHGTSIEGIERIIDCDHVVRGEGIRWMRRWLGENEHAPIRHPALISADRKRIFGVPIPGMCGLLVPGVGCVNGCRFCATSHFFDRAYTPFYSSGEDLYRQACRIGDELGCGEFFVLDENFLKHGTRAQELLACMQRDRRPFRFSVFSSAEAIESFGIENMVRLGIEFVWVGAESKRETYEKNKGRDLGAMVRNLRDHGICVLVSGILFLEHHTPENIWEDIDYIIGLEGDFTQFMMFTAMPGTRLYGQYKEQGTLDFDLPYEEWHGQHLLNFRHPHFTGEEACRLIGEAFQAEFDRLSSSVARMTETALRGFRTLETLASRDPWMQFRRAQMRQRAEDLRNLLPTMARFAHNEVERQHIAHLKQVFVQTMGPESMRARGRAAGVSVIAQVASWHSQLLGDLVQPRRIVTRYRWAEPSAQPAEERPSGICPNRAPATVDGTWASRAAAS